MLPSPVSGSEVMPLGVTAGPFFTVRVKFCVPFGNTPLTALKMRGWVPTVPAAGVPDKIPVTGSNVTPVGRVPDYCKSGCRGTHCCHREGARQPEAEGGVIRAGNGRSFSDCQGEVLDCIRQYTVGGSECERIGAACASCRRTAQHTRGRNEVYARR